MTTIDFQKKFRLQRANLSLHIMDKVFSLIVPCIVILYGLRYLGQLQYNVLWQHSVVTKVKIYTPVRKSLDPPLYDQTIGYQIKIPLHSSWIVLY